MAVPGDPAKFNWSGGTSASRGIVTGGNAIGIAARKVREKALRIAAGLLEVSPDDLELAGGAVRVRGAPDTALALGALATVANPIRYAYRKEALGAALRLRQPGGGGGPAPGAQPAPAAQGFSA